MTKSFSPGLAAADAATIDWERVRSKIKADQQAMEDLFAVDSGKNQKVFHERAKRMANRLRDQSKTETVTVMTFQLGVERYGLPLSDLREILPFGECTPIPGAPAELKGAISVRGEIRCVIDLGAVLGLTIPNSEENPGYTLLLRSEGNEVGLHVTQVNQVEIIKAESIVNQDGISSGMVGHFLKGISSNSLILLNLNQVLMHPIFKGVS